MGYLGREAAKKRAVLTLLVQMGRRAAFVRGGKVMLRRRKCGRAVKGDHVEEVVEVNGRCEVETTER